MAEYENHEEHLRCDLTDPEVRDRADSMARKIRDRDELEEQRAAESKLAKADIDLLDASIRGLAREVREKAAYRMVECENQADHAKGCMHTVRTDTGEIIRSRDLTEEEKQLHLGVFVKDPHQNTG